MRKGWLCKKDMAGYASRRLDPIGILPVHARARGTETSFIPG
jgi:hypothetical protein